MTQSPGPDRPGRHTERAPREAVRPAPEGSGPIPPMSGLWSADGRLFSPLFSSQALNDNVGTVEHMLQGWQEALDSQRAVLDSMRDMLRRQQDLMLSATRSMVVAALNPGPGAGSGMPSLERCAAEYGAAWRRGLDQYWAQLQAMTEMPSVLPWAANEADAPRRGDRTG